jgi:hypothetical protein
VVQQACPFGKLRACPELAEELTTNGITPFILSLLKWLRIDGESLFHL